MFQSFGLGKAGPYYATKPVPVLQSFVLQCHNGKEVHTIEAEDYSLQAAIKAAQAAGYRLVSQRS